MKPETEKPERDPRDELLVRYEGGMMTLLLVVAAAILALIIWLGWMVLT
jgi:hypothetical protein